MSDTTDVAVPETAGDVEASDALRMLNVVRIDDSDLRAWTSIDDALAEFAKSGMDVYLANEVIGSGYQVIDKKELVNIPFLLVNWRFVASTEYDGAFVVATGITGTSPARRFIFTDGSTGVRNQLANESKRRADANIPHLNAGLMVPKGLTVSEFEVEGEDGKPKKARTYYISTQG